MEGEFAAVAYSKSQFYIGKIPMGEGGGGGDEFDKSEEDEDLQENSKNFVKLTFWCGIKFPKLYIGPSYDDIDIVEEKFVYGKDV